MNQTVLVAFIGAGGVVFGAALSFLASAFASRQKIKELELTYNQKLQDNYLANARNYINTVYMPINIQLSKLESRYYKFKTCIGSYKEDTEEFKRGLEEFRQACDNFNEEISKLIDRGEDAYLISKIEIILRSFNNFVESSKNAGKHSLSVTGKIRLRFLGFEQSIERIQEGKLNKDVEAKLFLAIQNIKPFTRLMNLTTTTFMFSYFEANIIILAAPVTSLAFEKRIYSDLPMLKTFIKEVTLGTNPVNTL